MNRQNPIDKEFDDPNFCFIVTCEEIKNTLLSIQKDLQVIENPEVKGFALERFLKYKQDYWKLMESDIKLSAMINSAEQPQMQLENENDFIPFK